MFPLSVLKVFGADILGSRIAQIALAFGVAWLWSGMHTNHLWRLKDAARQAAFEAAYQREVARQAVATQEIAAAATVRAEEDAALERELRAQIDAFNKQETGGDAKIPLTSDGHIKAVHPIQRVDSEFLERLRKLDAAAVHRKGKASGRSR